MKTESTRTTATKTKYNLGLIQALRVLSYPDDSRKKTEHFGIPSSGRLGQILNRKILEISLGPLQQLRAAWVLGLIRRRGDFLKAV